MNIHLTNKNMLVLMEPNKLHAAVCWLVMGFGLAGVVAVPISNLPIYSIVIPILILLGGTIAWRFSGLPLLVVADKSKNELAIRIPPQFGARYESQKYMLQKVASVELVESTKSGAVKRGEALPGTYAVFVGFTDGKFIPICHYHHKYHYRAQACVALIEFLGLNQQPAQPAAPGQQGEGERKAG